MGWFKRTDKDSDDIHSAPGSSSKKGKRKVWGIKRRALDMIIEASKDSYENGHEFAAVLRAKIDVIIELLLLPDGGLRGRTSVMVYLHMLPIDFTVVGSVHSHPSSNYYPSDADLQFFGRAGEINIIIALSHLQT